MEIGMESRWNHVGLCRERSLGCHLATEGLSFPFKYESS
jgi:hypothetical protein